MQNLRTHPLCGEKPTGGEKTQEWLVVSFQPLWFAPYRSNASWLGLSGFTHEELEPTETGCNFCRGPWPATGGVRRAFRDSFAILRRWNCCFNRLCRVPIIRGLLLQPIPVYNLVKSRSGARFGRCSFLYQNTVFFVQETEQFQPVPSDGCYVGATSAFLHHPAAEIEGIYHNCKLRFSIPGPTRGGYCLLYTSPSPRDA